jgi:NADPH:quinone reductase-like Zn-dependent oxidoreductase
VQPLARNQSEVSLSNSLPWKGAFVITPVSEGDTSFVRELGAHEVIDYRKIRFEELVTDADLFLDPVGGDTLRASFRAVKPAGRVITIDN